MDTTTDVAPIRYTTMGEQYEMPRDLAERIWVRSITG